MAGLVSADSALLLLLMTCNVDLNARLRPRPLLLRLGIRRNSTGQNRRLRPAPSPPANQYVGVKPKAGDVFQSCFCEDELQNILDRFSSVTYKDTTNTEVNFDVEVLLRGHRDQSVGDKVRKRVEDNVTDIDSTTYFVSNEGLVPFLTLLGLFKDSVPLTEESINPERLWRTSKFASYGSNLAFVLSSWWVSALLNEVNIQLPGCYTPYGCPWDRFVESYGFLQNCDFPNLCGGISYHLRRSQIWHVLYTMNNWE
ncbi:histidine acid phosphatase superfamily protein [Penaeus vannamei]|uniref:Histidine acid phosphatase superfamily protein n=1 Tax=Penaeus vannamei TaxID=6689 RepID=A0A423T736_PENVA|nr:histidine acid phosphatase superfamily protein [Penaeus vannamei]